MTKIKSWKRLSLRLGCVPRSLRGRSTPQPGSRYGSREAARYEGWNLDWISEKDAAELYDLLIEFFEVDGGWEMLERLRRKLGHPQPRR